MEIKDYVNKALPQGKVLTTVKVDKPLYDKILELKGSVSMTKLVEALLRRFVDENKNL